MEKGSILFLRELARRSVPVAVMGIMLTASLFFDSTATAFPTDVGGSWNGSVPCSSPAIVRISDITNNTTGSSSFANSPFSPGITENPYVSGSQGAKRWLTPGATPPGWHSPGPSCSITNSMGQTIASFVEIDGVGRGPWNYGDCRTKFDPVNGGSPLPPGHWCDSYGNLFDPVMVPNYSTSCVSPMDPTCYGRIHVEFDGDWLAAGYCGSGVCDNNTLVQDTVAKSASTLIDVQGFVFWDPDHVNDTFHSFSGWELHPLTAWRMHQVAPPDFSIATSPTTMTISAGSSGTSTVTLTGLNGFTGGLDLTATVESGGLISLSPPSASLNPTTMTVSSGGTGTSTLTVSTSLLTTPGTYTVTVTATSGTLSHSATVTVTVTLNLGLLP